MVHVTVLVSDTKAEQAIEDVLTAVGVGDTTMIIEGRNSIYNEGKTPSSRSQLC